jgi:hypothetical protein
MLRQVRTNFTLPRSPAPPQADSTLLLLLLRVTSDLLLQAPHEKRPSNISLGCTHIRRGGAGGCCLRQGHSQAGQTTDTLSLVPGLRNIAADNNNK